MTRYELFELLERAQTEKWEKLDLSECFVQELPPELGQLTSLTTLNLYRNELRTLPPEIAQLRSLKVLNLRRNKLHTLPLEITQLPSLDNLCLGDNQLTSLPSEIAQLQSLKRLDLSRNQLSQLPIDISQLQALQKLDLSSNQFASLPSGITQLNSLLLLYLDRNKILSLNSEIGEFRLLALLSVSGNQLSSLPPEIGQLKFLQSLDLALNKISSLPSRIGYLKSLEHLDLRYNQLGSLPPEIGLLTSLETLQISHNHLKTLPSEVRFLTSLKALDISHNQLHSLPLEIGQLQSLSFPLDLRSNQITSLPRSILKLSKLSELDLRDNPIQIPPEILNSQEWPGQPGSLDKLLNFYFGTQESTGDFYESKLLILGDGGAGKTTLANKLQDPRYRLRKNEESTEGINILRWNIDHPDGNSLRVNIWDFGGQEIYHSTHQFFLTKRSVYVLVADDRREDTDFYYWLSIIKLLSDNSPVIILKNEKQGRQCAIDERSLRHEFTSLRPILTADLAQNDDKLQKLSRTIQTELCQLDHIGTPMPAHWAKIRAVLENISNRHNYISRQEFYGYCRQHGFSDEKEMLAASQFLHDLGICLHFQKVKGLKKVLILKPTWATNAVYKILDSPNVRQNYGCFTDDTLEEIWDQGDVAEMRDELLLLMMEFGLCYEIPHKKGNYISPQLLSKERPAYPWDTTDTLTLRYEYTFKPKSIFPQFVVATHDKIENQCLVWKHGVVLTDGNTRAEIIEEDRYHKAEIKIRVSGTDKRGFLSYVAREIEKLSNTYDRIEYKTLIPCNCRVCKTSATPHTYTWDNLRRRLANHIYEVQCDISYDQVSVRSLIDDIAVLLVDPRGDRWGMGPDGRGRSSPFGTEGTGNIYNTYHVENQTLQQDQTMGNTVNARHFGTGDIIGGDKIVGDQIAGDKIGVQNISQEHQEIAQEIKAIVLEESAIYDLSTDKAKQKAGRDVVEAINSNPTLQQRLIGAVKGGGETAIKKVLNHPVADIAIDTIKGFQKGA